jgi:hypothetical protein
MHRAETMTPYFGGPEGGMGSGHAGHGAHHKQEGGMHGPVVTDGDVRERCVHDLPGGVSALGCAPENPVRPRWRPPLLLLHHLSVSLD